MKLRLFLLLVFIPALLRSQDLETGQLIGHTGEITQLVFTPDGKYLFSSSRSDNKIFMWDVNSGKLINSSPEMAINDMVVSPTGEYVTTSDYLGYLWDVKRKRAEAVSDDFHVSYFTEEGNYLINKRRNYPYKIKDGEVTIVQTEFTNWAAIVKFLEYEGRLYGVMDGPEFWNISANRPTTGDTIPILKERHSRLIVPPSNIKLRTVHASNQKKGIYAKALKDNSIEIRDIQSDKLLQTCKGHVNKWVNASFNYPILEVNDKDRDLQWNLMDNSFEKEKVSVSPVSPFEKTDARPSEENWYDPVPFNSENKMFTVTCLPWWRDEARLRDYTLINNNDGSQKELTIDKWLRQLGVSNDGKFMIANTDQYNILLYNTETEEILGEFEGHQGTGFSSIQFTPDGKYVLSTGNDGSMILIDLITKKKLFTFFIIDENDWLITTPSGLFDASPATMNLMYYTRGFEIIEFEQLKERYFEPGLLNKVMTGQELRDAEVLDDVELYPLIEADITGHILNVKLTERNGGIGRVSLFINGKEVEEDINPGRALNIKLDIGKYRKYFQVNENNDVSLRSWNSAGWLKSSQVELNYFKPGGIGDFGLGMNEKPKLYGLIIGTSDYSGEELDLKYADKDAEYIFKAISESGAALFGADRTNVKLMTTRSAGPSGLSSKENIRDAFQPLQRINSRDVLIIYFSGHGISYKDQFYYLTEEVASEEAIDDPALREHYMISTDELTSWLTSIPTM